jgi:membrane fusion protein (multidrug efflux system)
MNTTAKASAPLLETPIQERERPSTSPNVEALGPKAARPNRVRPILFAVLLVAGLVWTTRYAHRLLTHAETDNAYITGHLHQVSPRIAGTILEVLAEENTKVEAGAPLVRLDPRDNDTKVLQAKALLALADTKIAQAESDLVEMKAKVAQALAQLEKAQLDFNRVHDLAQTKVASKQEYDAAKASFDSAKAGADSARATANASEAALEAARAQRKAGELYLEDAELQRSYNVVTAPVAGTIGKRNAEVGNRVQAGQALFAIMEPEVWIVANFKETQIAKMNAGQAVEITIDALPGAHFTGTVESFSPASGASFALLPADNATGNFTKVVQRVPVRIRFDAASIRGYEEKLRAGLSAVVAVEVK